MRFAAVFLLTFLGTAAPAGAVDVPLPVKKPRNANGQPLVSPPAANPATAGAVMPVQPAPPASSRPQ
ncbi:MAG: hypothetical protein ACM3L9_06050, partial [Deltaproteobacteria bacterium]